MDDIEIQALDSLESEHWWYQNRRIELQIFLSTIPRSFKVLDLGSASGSNTMFMQQLGFSQIVSVEYSEFGCTLQRNKGIPVVQADACDLPFQSSEFDLVVCMDVLEHIERDDSAIREIWRVLKSGGTTLISVPENPGLWSNHDVVVGHYRRYSKSNLINLFTNCGFSVCKIFSSHCTLKPLIRVIRQFSKGSSLKPVNPFLNSLLLLTAKFERNLGLQKVGGTTLWISARKVEESRINKLS